MNAVALPQFDPQALDELVQQFETGWPRKLEATMAYLDAFDTWLESRTAMSESDRRSIAGDRAKILFARASLAIADGALDRGLRLANESARHAEEAGATHRWVRALCVAARCSEDLGLQADSTRHITRALDLAEQHNDERGLGHSLHTLCYLYDAQGAHEKMLEIAQRTRAIAQRIDDADMLVRSLNALSLACGFLDRHEEALAWTNEALAVSAAEGMIESQRLLTFNLIFHYTRCGRPDEAIELATEVDELINTLPPQQAAVIHVDIAEAHAVAGDHQAALAMLRRAALGGEQANRYLLRYYEVAADLHEAMGDDQQALEMLQKYLACEREARGSEAQERLVALERHFSTELAAKSAEVYHLRNVELVEKNQALEEAARERETLLQILMRDLRVPLARTKGLSQALLADLPTAPDEVKEVDLVERLQFIDAAAAEMQDTIETLLNHQWVSEQR